jgi:hypothetical protein
VAARSTWVAVAAAAGVIIAVGAVIAAVWVELGDARMSAAGWVAMAIGIVATLALGIGLMALVFISNRRGFDDTDGPRR